ncbi:MAG: transposase [Proteobacteria bacterium]|nr:MAG: transposase [Pseudomonadota bacterium]
MDFVCLDVETANADFASICQIGIAKYRNGAVVDEYVEFVNPDDYFDEMNVYIHGITERTVKNSKRFNQLVGDVLDFIGDDFCFTHTGFDRVSVNRACLKYQLPETDVEWRDSSMVARRTWDDFKYKGYGLDNVCSFLGYEFKHHDALEDAKAAGHVIMSALEKYPGGFDELIERLGKPLSPHVYEKVAREGNQEGIFYGQSLVFTGALTIVRREAADYASQLGFSVKSSVSKKTDILVVGDQDIEKLAGHSKSSKHRKADELNRNGAGIKIIKESDFVALHKSEEL